MWGLPSPGTASPYMPSALIPCPSVFSIVRKVIPNPRIPECPSRLPPVTQSPTFSSLPTSGPSESFLRTVICFAARTCNVVRSLAVMRSKGGSCSLSLFQSGQAVDFQAMQRSGERGKGSSLRDQLCGSSGTHVWSTWEKKVAFVGYCCWPGSQGRLFVHLIWMARPRFGACK